MATKPLPPRPVAPRAVKAKPAGGPAEPRPIRPPELVEIKRALAQRDRPALRRLWIRFSGIALAPDDLKWVFRLAVAAGEFEKADTMFATVLARGAVEFGDACLALQTKQVLRLEPDMAALFPGAVLDQATSPSAQQLSLLAAAATAHFVSGKAEAASLFDYLERYRGERPLVDPVHHGRALMASRQFDRAFAVLRAADTERPLDGEALCCLADTALIVGESEVAEAAFRRLSASGHRSVYFLERYLDFAVRQGRPEEALRLLEEVSGLIPTEAHARLSMLLGMARRDLDQVAAASAALPPDMLRALGNRLAEFGYAILNAGRMEDVTRFETLLEALSGDAPDLLQLTIDLAFRRQDYAAAAEAIERGEQFGDAARAPLFRLKRAEQQAFTGRLDEAVATIAALGPLADLPAGYLSPIVALFAEAGEWPQILTLVKTRLAEWFVFDSHGAAVLGAAAAEDGWQDVIEAIERAGGDTATLELRKLKLVLLERLTDPSGLSELIDQQELTGLEGYAARLQARIDALSARPHDGAPDPDTVRDHAVYYCADRNYLAPALNSINSLLLTNQAGLADLAIYLFVEDEDAAVAEQVAAALRERFACALTIVSMRPLLADFGGALKTGYGLFTGGWQLSQAAYYRIFAIRHLLEIETARRILYIDADTLVTGDVFRIFSALDGCAPLAARPEVDKLDVRRVEALHGLERGTFFNSGVLLFDMAHPDLRDRIDRTFVEIAEHSDKLVYHDQCALNRAFIGAAAALPTAYNSFCTNRDGLSSDGATGIILHFLDRPKPWQAGYSGPFGAFWYRYWRELAAVVDPAVMRDLLAKSPV